MAIKPLIDVLYGLLKDLLICSWRGHLAPKAQNVRPGTAAPCRRCQTPLIWMGYKHGWRRT